MFNLAQQQSLQPQSHLHHHNPLLNMNAHAVSLNFNTNDKSLSPKKKKRKYNYMSPTMISSNIETTTTTTTPNKPITSDSFISTICSMQKLSNSSFTRNNSNQSIRSLNILDRVLDTSKYTANTTLYTMCRDWTNATGSINDSPNSSLKQQQPSPKQDKKSSQDVTVLPEPLCDDDGDEFSNVTIEQLNENIKVNIRSSQESDIELIKRLNVDDELGMHALLKLHVNRWKMAKREWFNYYSVQSKPYENSYQTLKAIFEDIA